MGQAEREARMLSAVYRTYGEDAVWTPAGGGAPAPCRVQLRTEDRETGFGAGQALRRSTVLLVRVSELPAPAKADQATVTGGRWAGTWTVLADPQLTTDGLEWACEVKGP